MSEQIPPCTCDCIHHWHQCERAPAYRYLTLADALAAAVERVAEALVNETGDHPDTWAVTGEPARGYWRGLAQVAIRALVCVQTARLRAALARLISAVEQLSEARTVTRPMGSTRHHQVAWTNARAALDEARAVLDAAARATRTAD